MFDSCGALATESLAPGRYRSRYHVRQDKRLIRGAPASSRAGLAR
jgi:hypothetical protein